LAHEKGDVQLSINDPRMFAAIWSMAGVAINLFLLTNFLTNSFFTGNWKKHELFQL